MTVTAGFLILTTLGILLPAFFQSHHFLQNLEPYPDGLIFSLSAWNLVRGSGFGLAYDDSFKSSWVGPFYAALNIPGYAVSQIPSMFYLTNIFLAISSLLVLLSICKKITQSRWILLCAGILYLSHGYILWLPSLPMAENASLFLFLIGYRIGITSTKFSTKHLLGLATVAILLSMTKYSMIGTAVIFFAIAIYRAEIKVRKQFLILLCILMTLTFFLPMFHSLSLIRLFIEFFQDLRLQRNTFFSIEYIPANIVFYFQTLLGAQQSFLWKTVPLTALGIFVIPFFIWMCFRTNFTSNQRKNWAGLTMLLVSQFPLMLLFYTTDTRYVILTIPILVLACILLLETFSKQKRGAAAVISLILFFFTQASAQLPLYKEIIASNLFGKSHGWQAESIKNVNEIINRHSQTKASSQPIYLITALPPFLYEAYAPDPEYQLLPLSTFQEFASKGEWVWGSSTKIEPLNSSQLKEYFHSLLRKNDQVYITNAYITHSREVLSDYEALKKEFTFSPVGTGCQNSCDVFELRMNQQ